MLKKVVTYTNFEGEQVTETLHFNLTKAELMEMELSVDGGLTSLIKKVVKADSHPEIFRIFKDLILKAYGIRDGSHFIKSTAISEEFSHTEAFSELFMTVVQDADEASAFISGILPDVPEEALEKAKAELDI